MVHWKQFWDQFNVAVHSRTSLSDAEKTVYLQSAIKDGAARNAIEGLSHSGDNYKEAIECLKSRYDKPRLIQRTHVQFIVDAPPMKEGSGRELRALHDTVQQHARTNQSIRISGIGGLSHKAPIQSVSSFRITSVQSSARVFEINAVVIPRVSCDLPSNPICLDSKWDHLSDLTLADPSFGQPGRIDLLLGVDVFMDILRNGRRKGSPGSPTAFETDFGWVLGGSTGPLDISTQSNFHVSTFHATMYSESFGRSKSPPSDHACLSAEERAVVHHFDSNHKRSREGPLPKDLNARPIGESRSQATKRFFSLERSLNAKGCFQAFDAVMREYIDTPRSFLSRI